MGDCTSEMTDEEKEVLSDRLNGIGWRLTDEIEYTEYYLYILKSSEKKKRELQEEVATILSEIGQGRCFMVPVDFKI